jgi:hypothetical protein
MVEAASTAIAAAAAPTIAIDNEALEGAAWLIDIPETFELLQHGRSLLRRVGTLFGTALYCLFVIGRNASCVGLRPNEGTTL